jgi:hypothetical protein
MSRPILNFIGFLLVLGLIIVDALSQTKDEGEKLNSIEAYDKLLDLVFPRGFGGTKGLWVVATITVRFRPSFDGYEAQINIVKYADGSAEAEILTLPKGSEIVYSRLEAARKNNGSGGLKKLAESIVVERRLVRDSESLRQILRQLGTIQISTNLSSAITLDGDRYELWYKGGSDSYYYSLSNGESYNGGLHPLVKWMNEVKQSLIR